MSLNKELPYGTPLHNRVRDRILAFKRLSEHKLADRRSAWARQEDLHRLYVNKSDNDLTREGLKTQGKPQYTTIEIPFSYAMLLTTHTYLSSVFLSRAPIHQFLARHGQPEQATLGLEALIDYQIQVGGAIPKYYIWIHDMLKYGIGVIGEYWDESYTNISQIVEESRTFMGMEVPGTKRKVRKLLKAKSYAGNRIYNVRPADWLPDPRVSLMNFQDGEFCGRITDVSWNSAVRSLDSGKYYNAAALKSVAAGTLQLQRDQGGVTTTLPDITRDDLLSLETQAGTPKGFRAVEMEIELIPRDWGLGEGDLPEKWVFTLANDAVVCESRPCGEFHGKFNFSIMEYEIEGYNISKRGMMEIAQPLNDTLTWLINTHFFNIRKALNDQIVYDPSRVVTRDITDPNAGRLIRLTPLAYGTDPRSAVHQLQVSDVTRQHLGDTQIVGDLLQRLTGAVDNIMGMVNSGGRKTATEVRSSTTFGVNRLKTLAEYASAVGWSPHSQKLVQNTQQFYDQEQVFRVAGDLAPQVSPFVSVSPEAIQGFWDFVPIDGTMPVDRYAMANLWKEILIGIRNVPEVAQQYSVPSMFAWMAKLAGLRNIEQFRINVASPDAIQNGVANGRLEPLAAGATAPASTNPERVAGPAQIPGLGPSA